MSRRRGVPERDVAVGEAAAVRGIDVAHQMAHVGVGHRLHVARRGLRGLMQHEHRGFAGVGDTVGAQGGEPQIVHAQHHRVMVVVRADRGTVVAHRHAA